MLIETIVIKILYEIFLFAHLDIPIDNVIINRKILPKNGI